MPKWKNIDIPVQVYSVPTVFRGHCGVTGMGFAGTGPGWTSPTRARPVCHPSQGQAKVGQLTRYLYLLLFNHGYPQWRSLSSDEPESHGQGGQYSNWRCKTREDGTQGAEIPEGLWLAVFRQEAYCMHMWDSFIQSLIDWANTIDDPFGTNEHPDLGITLQNIWDMTFTDLDLNIEEFPAIQKIVSSLQVLQTALLMTLMVWLIKLQACNHLNDWRSMMGKAALNVVTKHLMSKPTLRNDVHVHANFIQGPLNSDISENHTIYHSFTPNRRYLFSYLNRSNR